MPVRKGITEGGNLAIWHPGRKRREDLAFEDWASLVPEGTDSEVNPHKDLSLPARHEGKWHSKKFHVHST